MNIDYNFPNMRARDRVVDAPDNYQAPSNATLTLGCVACWNVQTMQWAELKLPLACR